VPGFIAFGCSVQPSSPITVPISRFFEGALLLLVSSGFVTLVATGKLDFPSILAVSGALVIRGYAFITGRNWQLPEKWTGYLTLLYLAVYILDFLTGTFVSATVHLVLFSLIVKLFSIHRDRDYVYLAVLSFLSVLAASVLTVDAIFFAAFIIFVVLAVVTFASFEMRRSAMAADVSAHDLHLPPARLRRSLGSLTAVLVIGIFAGATVIFFALPRVTSSYLGRFAPHNRYVTGFSNTVQLGDIGRVQQSDAVVMHVQLLPGYRFPQEIYWRGVALSLFDGKRWYNPPSASGTQRLLDARSMFVPSLQNAPRRELRYRVLMEPIGTNVFFGLPFLETVAGNYRNVVVDEYGAFTSFDRDRTVGMYTATSNIGRPQPDALRRAVADYPADTTVRYLQLPQVDPRVRRLARDITRDATNNYDRARAIENYLRVNFGYTLELPTHTMSDPIANFLFERKRGHCEYFASSMAIMLRTLGIPARIVNGFRGAEFNRVSGSYVVRARQAHSWVEAYFPDQGWITFDPTPAAGNASPEGFGELALYLDAAHEFWREWIINYDFSHQRTLGAATIDGSRVKLNSMRDAVDNWYSRTLAAAGRGQERLGSEPRRWTGMAVAFLVFVLLAINAPRIWRAVRSARAARSPRRNPEQAATIWYARMEKTVARRGWRKLPSQTPQEFIETIADPHLRITVERFTEKYERARFGESAEDAEQLSEVLEEVKRS
jgi:transglutaminase-like putative cysteine protease